MVNDEPQIHKLVEAAFQTKFKVVQAQSLAEAKRAFRSINTSLLAVVVMDASVDSSDAVDTVPLLQWIRKSFDGNVLCNSSHPEKNDVLMEHAGSPAFRHDSPTGLIQAIAAIVGEE